MSHFSALEQVRQHQAIVSKYQQALEVEPDDRKLHVGLMGAQKRLERSRRALLEASTVAHVDMVNYRIVRSRDEYPALSVSESLSGFQNAVIAVADAVLNGPKTKAQYSREIVDRASLNFGYTYPGSLGVVLFVPNDRGLFDDGTLDTSIDAFRDFLRVANTDEARDAARHLGLAAISRIYDWVSVNARWGNGVDYQWRRSDDIWLGEFVVRDKFSELKELLENAIEPEHHDLELVGNLVGFDVARRRFHIVTSDDDDISGKLDDTFTEPSAVVSENSRYRAIIRETETRYSATGKIETKYTLLRLEPDG